MFNKYMYRGTAIPIHSRKERLFPAMFIYKIVNNVNGDFYIGKTVTSLENRFKRHFYNHKDGQTYLYRAMRKYGFENFTIEILQEVNENIDEFERKYIKNLCPKYNMTKGGDGGDTSNSPNYKKSMKIYIESRDNKKCASYGMKGKKQSQKFHESIKKSNSCPVSCNGIIFDSVGDAQEHFKGISVRKRLDSEKYPDFFRLKPKTNRK